MYPCEGMYTGEEPVHHHHLPKLDDDDDCDDNDHDDDDHHHHHDHNPYPGQQHHNHPPPASSTPPPPHQHHNHNHHPTPKRSPMPPPLQPPTPLHPPQPLQPPTPLHPQPPLQPSIQLQPPPPSSPLPPPPRKPHPPPPMNLNHPHHYNDDDDDNDDKYQTPHRQLGAVVFILLLLLGLAALILWLIYRPSKPHFTAVAALVYSLNTTAATSASPPTVAASMQFVIHTRNPNKHTTLSYDHLAVTVYYRNTAITPPVAIPPLFHRKKSSVIIAPVVGGPQTAVAVEVGCDVVNGLAADEAYGVVGFSWVVVGRVRYRVGGFKSGHSRVYVKCDMVVRLVGVNGGVYTNPGGQVPLLGTPPCLVDI